MKFREIFPFVMPRSFLKRVWGGSRAVNHSMLESIMDARPSPRGTCQRFGVACEDARPSPQGTGRGRRKRGNR